MKLKQFYQARVQKFAQQAQALKSKYNRYSMVRLLSFFAGAGLFIFLLSLGAVWATGFAIIFLLLFGRFIKWHINIQKQQIHQEYLSRINQHELEAIQGNYQAFESGKNFIDPDHPYTVDLDIFGEHSFFQCINRCATSIGHQRLAEYLNKGVGPTEIEARQKAIADLKERIEWRQDFQAFGMETRDKARHVVALKRWLAAPTIVSHRKWLISVLIFGPFIFLPLFIWVGIFYPWQYLVLLLLLPGAILRKTLEAVNETHQQTYQAEKLLAIYAGLISHVELEDQFGSEKLKNLRSKFISDDQQASKQIARLSYLIGQLNTRQNFFAILLNLFALWDLQWVYQLERWKVKAQGRLEKWFDALAELEALISLSTLYFNNPDWIFPTILEQTQLEAKAVGHPLIQAQDRVCNDIQIPTGGHIKLVTGSNMAGKSTLLRTVGLNIVLAMIGAPVCAKSLKLPLLKVYTSMRTQDALHENTSSFYAELKRLKFIIDAVEKGDHIFFLLDEILKGTNSKDRHTGAKALIRQLIAQKGSGMVATHDLELGALEAQANGAIENLCMELRMG